MSAHLSPDDLKRIAPDLYEREFQEQPPKAPDDPAAKMRDEARRLNAETRLLLARERNRKAKEKPPAKSPPKPRALPPSFWFAAALALFQIALIFYLIIKY